MALHLDINASISGCSGDMLLAGLIGLWHKQSGIPESELLQQVLAHVVEVTEVDISATIEPVDTGLLRGYRIDLGGEDKFLGIRRIRSSLETLGRNLDSELPQRVLTMAFETLVEGEKVVHGVEDVHLHELGTVDTVLDLFGVVYIIEKLGVEAVSVHPIETGSGRVKTSHGIIPVPAPVTQYILSRSKLLTTQPSVVGEALTPTGATLLAAIKEVFGGRGSMVWNHTSAGFGTKTFEDRSNAVILRLGSTSQTRSTVTILETNLDDISGEHLGHASTVLMEHGALDVSYSPVFMKKNRPGWNFRVIVKDEDTDRLSQLIMKYTGTLGIRVYQQDRHISARTSSTVKTIKGVRVRMKLGEYGGKYEFDDLVKLSEVTGYSPLELERFLKEGDEL